LSFVFPKIQYFGRRRKIAVVKGDKMVWKEWSNKFSENGGFLGGRE